MVTQLILQNEERTIIAAIKLVRNDDITVVMRMLDALQDHYDTEEEIIIVDTRQPDEFGIYEVLIKIPRDEDEGGEYEETITVTPVPEY